MSGIVTIFNNKRPLMKESYRIEHMIGAMNQTGNEEYRCLHGNQALLGCCGNQAPMQCSQEYQGTIYSIVFYGNLYNQSELKQQLQKHVNWPLKHDVDIALAAYMHWQDDCVQHFQGVFSFVIVWNGALFAARDPMGIKPLYYLIRGDGEWILASEIKGILADGVLPVLTKEKFMKTIALGPSLVPGETIYKNIKSLMPGHCIKIQSNRHAIVPYYALRANPHNDGLDDTIATVRHLVEVAIERQINVDRPIGSMLSGGLDSSIVCAVASKQIQALPTFSLDYEENSEYFIGTSYQSSEDAPFIEEMNRQFHTNHKRHVIPQANVAAYLERAMVARDMPAMGDIDSSLLWFCEKLRQDVPIVLSGECADEVFGGYPWFYRPELVAMDTFPWLKSLPEKIGLLQEQHRGLDFYGVRKAAYEAALLEVRVLDTDSLEDKIARKMTYLCKDYFMQTLLSRQEGMANAANIEGRVPFADVALVNYVYNIPWSMKFLDGKEKGLLRKAFEDILPSQVANRKKSPYPKTYHPAYTKMVGEMLLPYVKGDGALTYLFDQKQLLQLIESGGASFDQPWFGQLMKGPQLLAYLYQMALWLTTYQVKIEF